MSPNTLATYSDALLWVVGATLVGLVVDQLLYWMLRDRARLRGFRTLGRIAMGLHWFPTTLGAVIGLNVAAPKLGFDADTLPVVRSVLLIALILVVTAFSARILAQLVQALTERDDVPFPNGSIFVNLARGTVWVVGGLMLLASIGVSIAPLVTALGVGGLAVGLALQPTLENVFSGIQLIASRQIQPGDFIRLDSGDEGTVLDVTWRNTMVQKASSDVLIVPNSILARSSVTNFSTQHREFTLLLPVSFASAGDPDAVERIAMEVAASVIADVEGAVPGSVPTVRFAELTPPAAVINVMIRCTSYQDRLPVRHELIRRLAKHFADEGVAAPPVAYPTNRRP